MPNRQNITRHKESSHFSHQVLLAYPMCEDNSQLFGFNFYHNSHFISHGTILS